MYTYYQLEKLSDILFELDPCSTMCKENLCYGEYDEFVVAITEEGGYNSIKLREAMEYYFSYYFDVDLSKEIVNNVLVRFKRAIGDIV